MCRYPSGRINDSSNMLQVPNMHVAYATAKRVGNRWVKAGHKHLSCCRCYSVRISVAFVGTLSLVCQATQPRSLRPWSLVSAQNNVMAVMFCRMSAVVYLVLVLRPSCGHARRVQVWMRCWATRTSPLRVDRLFAFCHHSGCEQGLIQGHPAGLVECSVPQPLASSVLAFIGYTSLYSVNTRVFADLPWLALLAMA